MGLRVCPKGHSYHKSSDCPTCPVCERERPASAPFMEGLYRPARRALESEGILSLEVLATYTEEEIMALHGIGKRAIPVLKEALKAAGMQFRGAKGS